MLPTSSSITPQTGAPLKDRLRSFRDGRGLSRAALATEIGVTAVTLYRWETGSTRPSPLAAERLRELGFGDVASAETNVGTVPRLTSGAGASGAAGHARTLKDAGRRTLRVQGGDVSILCAPFVRNGPPDQADFHDRLFALQATSPLPRHDLLRRLSMVESVQDLGVTAQHALERPRATAVSWNSNYGTHGWHRYVGRFPPHVIRSLLNHFGANRKSLVLDPFAGSGTTAVECRLMGIPFVGIEICPLSSLITRTKAAFPADPHLLRDVAERFSEFYERRWTKFLDGRSADEVGHRDVLDRRGNPVPSFANIERWFTTRALLGVSIAVEFAMTLDGFARDAVLLAVSARMRSIGNVDVDVVRAEYSKKPRANVDVQRLVVRSLKGMASDVAATLKSHEGLIGAPTEFSLHEGSVLDVELPNASVDCVITSPPYGIEAISYLRTHLLSYRSLVAHLHHDPYQTRAKTIGSEYLADLVATAAHRALRVSPTCRKFFASVPNDGADKKYEARRAGMCQFFDDMLAVGERLSKWLKDDGQVAFIVGNKRLGDDVIPTTAIVRELFAACDIEFVDEIRHKLKTNNSNSQVPWQERVIQEESILLFKRSRRRR